MGSATPDRPAGPSVDGDEHDRLPIAREVYWPARPSAGTSMPAPLEQELSLPERYPATVDVPADAFAGHGPEIGGRQRRALCRAAATMAAASGCSLECSRLAASRSTRPRGRRRPRRTAQPRPALGERAGLVDDQRVYVLQNLERLGVLDEHAGSAPRGRPRP